MSIDSLDDIPQECRDLLGDFLRDIEPLVSDIDWGNATMSDLEALGTSIDEPVSDMDVKMEQAGCDDIDFDGDDEQGFELSLELARQEAPGAVAWLEFLREVSTAFDTSGTAVDSADAPEDCDAALEAVRDLMSESETMTDLPVDQLMSAASILQSITSLCSIDEMAALFDDPAFTEWSGG